MRRTIACLPLLPLLSAIQVGDAVRRSPPGTGLTGCAFAPNWRSPARHTVRLSDRQSPWRMTRCLQQWDWTGDSLGRLSYATRVLSKYRQSSILRLPGALRSVVSSQTTTIDGRTTAPMSVRYFAPHRQPFTCIPGNRNFPRPRNEHWGHGPAVR